MGFVAILDLLVPISTGNQIVHFILLTSQVEHVKRNEKFPQTW
jgi:hypothetical protein